MKTKILDALIISKAHQNVPKRLGLELILRVDLLSLMRQNQQNHYTLLISVK